MNFGLGGPVRFFASTGPQRAFPSGGLLLSGGRPGRTFYFEKIRVFKAGLCSNILAWNNRIGRFGSILLVSRTIVMINRDGRGHQYSVVRGEILGFTED